MMNGINRKMRMRGLLAAGAASALFALPALAEEKTSSRTTSSDASVVIDDRATSAMQKVGEARLKVLLWSVYDSRLYTPNGRYNDGDRPLRLEIQYLRDVSAQDLVERTLIEWEAMGRSHPQQTAWLQQLEGLWPDIAASDVLTLELDEQGSATFLHNGRALGRLEDPEFGEQFVDIWLSRDCTRPAIRDALIGRQLASADD